MLLTSEEKSHEPDRSPQIGPSGPPDGVSFPDGTPENIRVSWYRYEEALENNTPYEEALAAFHWMEAARRNQLLQAKTKKHAVQPRGTRAQIRQLTTQAKLESLIENSCQAIEKFEPKEPGKFPRSTHDPFSVRESGRRNRGTRS